MAGEDSDDWEDDPDAPLDHALRPDRVAKKRYQQNGTQPQSSESDFEAWLTPAQALAALPDDWGRETKVGWINNRVSGAVLWVRCRRADGRNMVWSTPDSVPPPRWAGSRSGPDGDFWQTGDLVIEDGNGYDRWVDARLFDVRFDPSAFSAFERGPLEQQAVDKPDSTVVRTSPLSKAEAAQFCKAIVAGWPSATQDWAHEKALLFFPDKEIPRDWFRSILRSIRPNKKRGRQPKIEN